MDGRRIRGAPWPRRMAGLARRLLYANPLYRLTLAGRVPETLSPLAARAWPGDLAMGRAIVAGQRLAGDHPWAGARGDAWAQGFAWLADVRAVGSEEARTRARHLVATWIAGHQAWSLPAWRPDVLGRRIAAWLAALVFLDAAADDGLAAALRRSLAAQVRHLRRVAPFAGGDAGAFPAIEGLVLGGLCLPGFARSMDAGLALLGRELERQVLPDGGHVQRSPALQLEVLRHLIDLRAALAGAHVEVPLAVQGAIDRMTPMVRTLRLGDGGLALFNGAGEGDAALVDAVLAQAGVRGRAMASAPHSGFQRLAAGRTVVVIDTGRPPPGAQAHAGTLAFEMSAGRNRLVVNCGADAGDHGAWRAPLRTTAAHSTMAVDDTGSSRLADDGVRAGPLQVTARRRQADGDIWLEASHDGYARRFGLIHQRRLFLAASGDDLRGEDRLSGAGGHAFAVRFHLHPAVQASLIESRMAVLLKPPSGRGWRLQADGGDLELDDSVYFGGGVRKRTQQVVVSGRLAGAGAAVRWRLARLDR